MQRSVVVPVLVVAVLFLLLPPVAAMKDPSAVYCEAMGYTYTVMQTAEGPAGSCLLPDRTTVDSWQFLQGAAGQQFSYCAKQGYRQQVVRSYRTCGQFGLDECLVCVLSDGSSVEVTQLMNLSFAETSCGDGSCGLPENAVSCPADCTSGGRDNLCDGARDGRCDPDCPDGAGDPDCGGAPLPLLFLTGAVVLAAAIVGLYLYPKRKKTS
jgi:putative hemolysin